MTDTALATQVEVILRDHAGGEGAALPVLHAVQHAFGHIPEAAMALIAPALGLTQAELRDLVTFYPDFRAPPAGRHVLKLCRSEACQARGGQALIEAAKARLGVDWHETTPDGAVTLEPSYCLGLCACGPGAMVNGELHAKLDPERLERLLAGLLP